MRRWAMTTQHDAYRPRRPRALQDRFDTRRLADRLHEHVPVHVDARGRPAVRRGGADVLPRHRRREGRPQCSYKGGAPGFVQVLGPDGAVLPELRRQRHVPVDGQRAREPARRDAVHRLRRSPNRVRVSGRGDRSATTRRSSTATPAPSSSCTVAVDDVFPNCPRYIHRMSTAGAVGDRARRRRLGADRRLEVHADGHARCSPPTTRPVPLSSPAGPSSPSARRSSSAPARRTTTTRRRRRPAHRRRRRPSPPTTDAADGRRRRPTSDDARPPTTAPTTTDVAAGRPTRSRSASSSGDPDATSAVLWTRLDRRRPARRASTSRGRSPPTTRSPTVTADGHGRRRRPPTATACTSSPTSPGRSWYRFRAGGFTSPVGRAAPAPAGAAPSCASPRRRASTSRPASTPPTATSPSGRPTSSCSSATSSTRAPAQPDRRRAGALARRARADRPRRLPRPLRPVPRPTPTCRRRGRACPWLVIWDDHEVENNYAGLVPQDAGGRADVRRPPGRGLPGVVGAHAGAPARRRRRAPTPIIPRGPLGRPRRPGAARRAPVPQRPGVRRRHAVAPSRRAPRRSTRPARCSAPAQEAVARRASSPRRRRRGPVLGQQTVLTDLRLPNGAILNYDQWDGYAPARDRLLAAGRGRRAGRRADRRHPPRRRRRLPGVGAEFVTTSISSHGQRRPGAAADPRLVRRRRRRPSSLHRGYTRHTVTPTTWTAEYRIVDDVAACRRRRCRRGARSASMPRRATSVVDA